MSTTTITLRADGTLDEPTLRSTAVGIGKYATNSQEGRILGDPVFEMITEKRNHSPGYSCCGDVVHFMLSRLGLKDPTIVNRNDTTKWQSGLNISKLRYGSAKVGAWVDYKPGLLAKPGDAMIIGNDNASTHTFIVQEHTTSSLFSCDGGQFNLKEGPYNKKIGQPAINMCMREMKIMLGSLYTGTVEKNNWRRIMGWIDISKINFPDQVDLDDDIFVDFVENPYA